MIFTLQLRVDQIPLILDHVFKALTVGLIEGYCCIYVLYYLTLVIQQNIQPFAFFRSQAHSFCLDSDNGPGYRCSCSPGYQSNPYIPSGCQDVDECADPMLNDCEERSCINQKGSYTCDCPRDYYGDGQKNGEGCAGCQLRVIKIVAGSGVGLVLLLASGGWFYLGLKKRKLIKLKKHYFQQNGGLMLQKQLLRPEGSIDTTKIFTEEELKMATNNFDESRIIGRGGYGTVYKAELPDQRVVAMKKSKIVDRRQNDQFINEVVVLLQVNHKNVIKLFGCCLETEVPLLVYEFVTNCTLSDHIHQENTTSTATIP
ncbi:hypothetical protein PRUPE_1G442400 [Prunus persica]|uniref:Protein kinase domain-containing protein n=1 Tax=Prunus persica TaxID=3760 RepID=A0A251RCE2_PRUPE|nr:hypothetical protein PRUPE_1G442400 [Prunus persica]